MKECPDCKQEFESTMQFCMECGTRLEEKAVHCISCNEALKPNMKFCPSCGSPQQKVSGTVAPGSKPAGIVLGDKNVIAGDIISGKEDYNISGNATFIKNVDESGSVVKCAICGKRMKIIESFECPRCHAEVCGSHYHDNTSDCEVCNPQKKTTQQNIAQSDQLTGQGRNAFDNGDYSLAIKLFNQAVELNPQNHKAYVGLSDVYNSKLEYDDAMRFINRALQINPDYHEAYLGKAYILMNTNKMDESYQCILKALDLQPNFADGHKGLADYYIDINEYDKARRSLKRAIEIDPGHYKAVNKLGFIDMLEGNHEKGITMFQKALEIKPGYFISLCDIGVAYYELNNLPEAIEYLNKSVQSKADYDFAHWLLAESYFKLDDLDKAEHHFQRGLECNNMNDNIWTGYGIFENRRGNTGKAIEYLKKALQLNPGNNVAQSNLDSINDPSLEQLMDLFKILMTERGYNAYTNMKFGSEEVDFVFYGPNTIYLVYIFCFKKEEWTASETETDDEEPSWENEDTYITSPVYFLNNCRTMLMESLMTLGMDVNDEDNNDQFENPDGKSQIELTAHNNYLLKINPIVVIGKGKITNSLEMRDVWREKNVAVVTFASGEAFGVPSAESAIDWVVGKQPIPDDVLNTLALALVNCEDDDDEEEED